MALAKDETADAAGMFGLPVVLCLVFGGVCHNAFVRLCNQDAV